MQKQVEIELSKEKTVIVSFLAWKADRKSFFALNKKNRPLVVDLVPPNPPNACWLESPFPDCAPTRVRRVRLLRAPYRWTKDEATLIEKFSCSVNVYPRTKQEEINLAFNQFADKSRIGRKLNPPSLWEVVWAKSSGPVLFATEEAGNDFENRMSGTDLVLLKGREELCLYRPDLVRSFDSWVHRESFTPLTDGMRESLGRKRQASQEELKVSMAAVSGTVEFESDAPAYITRLDFRSLDEFTAGEISQLRSHLSLKLTEKLRKKLAGQSGKRDVPADEFDENKPCPQAASDYKQQTKTTHTTEEHSHLEERWCVELDSTDTKHFYCDKQRYRCQEYHWNTIRLCLENVDLIKQVKAQAKWMTVRSDGMIRLTVQDMFKEAAREKVEKYPCYLKQSTFFKEMERTGKEKLFETFGDSRYLLWLPHRVRSTPSSNH